MALRIISVELGCRVRSTDTPRRDRIRFTLSLTGVPPVVSEGEKMNSCRAQSGGWRGYVSGVQFCVRERERERERGVGRQKW